MVREQVWLDLLGIFLFYDNDLILGGEPPLSTLVAGHIAVENSAYLPATIGVRGGRTAERRETFTHPRGKTAE